MGMGNPKADWLVIFYLHGFFQRDGSNLKTAVANFLKKIPKCLLEIRLIGIINVIHLISAVYGVIRNKSSMRGPLNLASAWTKMSLNAFDSRIIELKESKA